MQGGSFHELYHCSKGLLETCKVLLLYPSSFDAEILTGWPSITSFFPQKLIRYVRMSKFEKAISMNPQFSSNL